MNIKHLIITVAILLVVTAVFGAASYALNLYTGPIIEANMAGAENEKFNAVMPNGKGYEQIDISALGLSTAVTAAYKETSGQGYVFELTVTGYAPGLVILCGVDADGKITGSKVLASNETYGLEGTLDNAYNGQTLETAEIIIAAGATPGSDTSEGYYAAIEAALQASVIVGGGKLDPSIVLMNLLPTVAPGFVELQDLNVSGNITSAFKAGNDAGFAYLMADGEDLYLAVVNAMGVCKLYDVEGADVTASHAALAAEAKAHADANQKSYLKTLSDKITKTLMKEATDITAIELDTFNTVVSAVSLTYEGATYYAFYSRSIGYKQMDVYVIVDANGAIVKVDAKTFIFDEEYFYGFGGLNVKDYKESLVGITPDTFTGEEVIIATATKTSDAMKQSMADVFAAFESIKGGAQ